MSGDGGGFLLGGIIILAALPYILAAAAIGAAAIGVYHVAKAIVRTAPRVHDRIDTHAAAAAAAGKAAAARQAAEQARVSRELTAMYDGIQKAADAQQQSLAAERVKLGRELEREAASAKQAIDRAAAKDLAEFRSTAAQTQTGLMQTVARDTGALYSRLEAVTRRQMQESIDALKQAQSTRMELVKWHEQTAAARLMQKELAEGLLADAATSVELMREIVGGNETRVMDDTLAKARSSFAAGSYQAAAVSAQNLISRCAQQIADRLRVENEEADTRVRLIARAEGVREYLKAAATVNGDEALADFAQGRYQQVTEHTERLLEQLRNAEGAALELAERQVEQLETESARVVNRATELYMDSVARDMVMDELAEALEPQGYVFSWRANPGDDPTQKLVAQFVGGNGARLSIVVDGGVREMALELHHYYEDGISVPETRKDALRELLEARLREKKLNAHFSCREETRNRASENVSERTQAAVTSQPAKQLI